MRGAAALLLLAGCYDPRLIEGRPPDGAAADVPAPPADGVDPAPDALTCTDAVCPDDLNECTMDECAPGFGCHQPLTGSRCGGMGRCDRCVGAVCTNLSVIAPSACMGVPLTCASTTSCYFVCGADLDFTTARDMCRLFGGRLATVETVEENECLRNALTGLTWFGLAQDPMGREPTGGWRHIDGSALVFESWAGAQPDDASGADVDCGQLHPTGLWYDEPCASVATGYLCELP
jgi:hypothetical protein